MSPSVRRRRRRWAVPVLAALGALGIAAAPNLIPAGAATPDLPPLTPAELLTKVHNAQVTALSGTIAMTANLGLPSLGGSLTGVGSGALLTSLLSGTHSANVWLDGPDHQRLALNAPMAETDWIHNRNDAWSWDSSSNSVVHVNLAAMKNDQKSAGPGSEDQKAGMLDTADANEPSKPADQTPEALANNLLAQVDPSTQVSVRTARYVADRPAYQLVIAPRSPKSTIGEIGISVDAATGLPIDVEITATGQSTPAFELGFTKLSFDTPSASEFDFKAPPGATVSESTDPMALMAPSGTRGEGHRRTKQALPSAPAPADDTATKPDVQTVGTAWETVAILPAGSPTQVGGLGSFLNSTPTVKLSDNTAAHVLATKLVNALFLADGRVAIGAVTPDALAAAVVGH
jgi:outer membrane lipoprotein-sorting protein